MRDNWKIVQFEKLGHTFGGLTNKTADDFGEGKPYIPYLNIFENGKIDPDYLEYVKIKSSERQNKVQFGDLFFTTSSETPHEVGMTSVLLSDLGEAYLNSFCFGFRLQNFEDLSPEFASYLFRGNEVRKTISDLAQGSTRYNLSKGILFDKLYLNLPPLPQQRKIAKILSTCDTVIAKTEEAIAKYQAIKQGMMHDLFTRGIDLSTGKLRPKYQDAPELYKESELGMIPKDWEVKRLEELGEVISGGTPSSTVEEFWNGDILWVTPADLSKLKFGEVTNTERKITLKGLNSSSALMIPKNSIVISSRAPIGYCAIVKDDFTTNQGCKSINLSTENISKFFYYNIIQHVNRIKLKGEGTTFAEISKKELEKIILTQPRKNEQKEISVRLESIDKKFKIEVANLKKYHQIKSGLMQDLLSGKVEVSVSKEEEIMNA